VGGLSQSTDVVGASPSPILLQYDDSTGGIVWENQIVSSSAAVVKPAEY